MKGSEMKTLLQITASFACIAVGVCALMGALYLNGVGKARNDSHQAAIDRHNVSVAILDNQRAYRQTLAEYNATYLPQLDTK